MNAEDLALVTIVDDGLPLEGKLGQVAMDSEIFLPFLGVGALAQSAAASSITRLISTIEPDQNFSCPALSLTSRPQNAESEMKAEEFVKWSGEAIASVDLYDQDEVKETVERLLYKAYLIGQGAPKDVVDLIGEHASEMIRLREDLAVARRFADTGGNLSTIADALTRLCDRVDALEAAEGQRSDVAAQMITEIEGIKAAVSSGYHDFIADQRRS